MSCVEDGTRTVLTIRNYSVKFGLIVLCTAVCGGLEMIGTERIGAMLAFEGQKVHEAAGWV
jgi:hypothetical protein